MLTREILQCELLRRNFVHRGAGIGHRPNLVGIELLPPVQRANQVYIDRYHPHELPVVGASIAETSHEVEVIWTNVEISRLCGLAS